MKKILLCILSIVLILTASLALAACCAKNGKKTNEIQSSEIIAMLDAGKHVELNGYVVWDDLDFTQLKNIARITPALCQTCTNSSLTFVGCVFTGKVSAHSKTAENRTAVTTVFARNLCFIDCDFRDEVNFSECLIEGNVVFTNSIFRKTAGWRAVHFKYKAAYFTGAKFEDEAFFQSAVFAGDASFLNAEFSKSAMFQNARAAGNMMFGNVSFGGYADFTYAAAAESVFLYARFKDRYDFLNAKLNILENHIYTD